MKTIIFALLAFAAIAAAMPEYNLETKDHKSLWSNYVKDYKLKFNIAEEEYRYKVFSNNVEYINMLNNESKADRRNTRFAVNKFAHLTTEEFSTYYLNNRMDDFIRASRTMPVAPEAPLEELSELPTSFDWRTVESPVVTPVKDQGRCGSCWTFSTTGNIEGVAAVAGHPLVSLSEQYLVDCDHTCNKDGVCNSGCEGGLMDLAFMGIMKRGGMMASADYPYKGNEMKCKFDQSKIVVSISNFTLLPKSAPQIQAYLYNNGPVAIAVDANNFQFYSSGIYKQSCTKRLNHAILLVGWGVETKKTLGGDTPYWIIKNSWSPTWGMKGFMLIERGIDKCGIEDYALSAVVDKPE